MADSRFNRPLDDASIVQLPKAADGWAEIGLRELLDADKRPSAIIDLHDPKGVIGPCYYNLAFNFILEHCYHAREDENVKAFNGWAQLFPPNDDVHQYHGCVWTATTLRQRWRIIMGNKNSLVRQCLNLEYKPDPSTIRKQADLAPALPSTPTSPAILPFTSQSRKRKHDETLADCPPQVPPGYDWTHEQPPPNLSPYVKALRDQDWSKTPLGEIKTWSPQLRLVANLLVADPHPAMLFWGEKLAQIYNEAALPILSNKHPKSLGEPYRETWKEIYASPEAGKLVDFLWDTGYNTGKGTGYEHQSFHILLNDKLEEKYFKLIMLPVLCKDGSVVGHYERFTDVTKDHLASRRQLTINKVSEATSCVQTLNDFYSHVLEALEDNLYDIPFCLLYSVDPEREKDDDNNDLPVVSKTDFSFARLEGNIGVQVDPDGRPVAMLLKDNAFKAAFQKACRTGESSNFKIDPELAQNLTQCPHERGFGDRPSELVLCPIEPVTQRTTAALLVLGINTRKTMDAEYQSFLRSLSRTVSATLASVMLLNMMSRRTLEAAQGEQIAKSMLAVSPVGAFLSSIEGEVLYANPMWYQLTEYNKYENEQRPMSWMAIVADDWREFAISEWSKLLKQKISHSCEMRLKKEWKGTDPVTGEMVRGGFYVLAEAAVQTIGEKEYISGCLTDISRQKWVEGYERERREEAVELKRQQENFIDMTSHEMRNPLSAIFQSADGIISALAQHQDCQTQFAASGSASGAREGTASPHGGTSPADDQIAFAIDAAQTISLCAQHQKRIVDDVLVLSKADANLLDVTAVDVQPRAFMEKSLKMFAAELASIGTQMDLCIEGSLERLGVDWVKLDPSRLLQVLINLCTNAIKFTSAGSTRKIRVAIGASIDPPTGLEYGLQWLPSEEGKIKDPTLRPEWGTGQQLFLTFSVEDTGRGITEDEMKSLFQRFSQGSPRTHTKYGGSGLGLFIAKLLTQLQGGEIGVRSKFSEGSTFAFYVKVRRSSAPNQVHVGSLAVPGQPGIRSSSSPAGQVAINILVVEDNIVNQKVLRRQLQNIGWVVHVANNGQEALDFIRTTRIWRGNETSGVALEIILMDVEMPIMNGTEATRELRRLQDDGSIIVHIPIIAITANARLEQVAGVLESGMDDVVAKPFRMPDLIPKVEGLLALET